MFYKLSPILKEFQNSEDSAEAREIEKENEDQHVTEEVCTRYFIQLCLLIIS